MRNGRPHSSDVAFTPSVKAVRPQRDLVQATSVWKSAALGRPASLPNLLISSRLRPVSFCHRQRRKAAIYPASRGPAGFLRVLDDKTIGFADFAGNRQYITQGNLADNPKAHLFLIDYAQPSGSRFGARHMSYKATPSLRHD